MYTKILHDYTPVIAVILIAAFISGCELAAPSSPPADNAVTTLEIAPLFGTLPKEIKLGLHARATFTDGRVEENVSSRARWFSTNPEILDVDTDGTLFTYKAGVSTISVTLGLISIAKEIKVSNATVDFLNIEAESLTIRPGMPFSLTVFAFMSDGSKLEISEDIDWFVRNSDSELLLDNDADVTVNTFNNNFFSLIPGESRITANYYNGGWNVSKTVVVNEVTLNQIRTSILYKSHVAGNSINLNAFGYYADGSILNVTSLATWEDRDNNSNLSLTDLSATPNQAGEYEITASINNTIDFSKFSVIDAEFKTIEIAPLPRNFALDEATHIQVYAIYDSGHAIDISTSVNWTSSNKKIIDISNVKGHAGKAHVIAKGTADISASLSPFIEDTITLTTNDATLVSIEITPKIESVVLDTSIQLNATGTYSDGSTHDISELVSWTSFQEEIDEETGVVELVFDETIVKIGNKRATAGRVEAIRAKEVIIKAGFKGKSDSITVTVSDTTLETITINSPNNIIYPDDQPTLTATGFFSDGTSQDISRQVSWQSSNPNMLTVSNHPFSQGQLTQINFGQITITATLNGISQGKQFTTSDATMTALSIQTPSENLTLDSALQLSAIASYPDDPERDVTANVYWYTEDQNTKIYNAPRVKGTVITKNSGDITIYATYQGVTTSLSLPAN